MDILRILLAAILAFVIGNVYYMSVQRLWHTYIGKTKKQVQKGFRKSVFFWWALTIFITTAIMDFLLEGVGAANGALVGLGIALIVVTVNVGYLLWETQDVGRWGLLRLNAGFTIISLVVIGLVIGW